MHVVRNVSQQVHLSELGAAGPARGAGQLVGHSLVQDGGDAHGDGEVRVPARA